MTVFRNRFRGGRWRYDFRAGGVRYQGYCVDPTTGEDAKSRPQAIEIEALVKRAVRRSNDASRSISTPGTFTLGQAVLLHIESQSESSPEHVANLELYSRELFQHFGHNRPIADIDQVEVDGYRTKAAKEKTLVWKGGPRKRAKMRPDQVARYMVRSEHQRSAASTNHYLDLLRAAFGVAHRIKDPVNGRPMLPYPPVVKPLPVPKRQPRPMPDAELYARLATAPPWVVDAAELARLFGLRRAEALGVTRHHIDREHRALAFTGAEAKSGRDELATPIATGWALLVRLERQAKARGVDHLVTWPGPRYGRAWAEGEIAAADIPRKEWRPLKSIRRAWRSTALKAKVERPHRLHDTRARYITEVAKVNRGLAKDAARHADPVTTERYIAVAASELAKAVRSVPAPNTGRRGASGRKRAGRA